MFRLFIEKDFESKGGRRKKDKNIYTQGYSINKVLFEKKNSEIFSIKVNSKLFKAKIISITPKYLFWGYSKWWQIKPWPRL